MRNMSYDRTVSAKCRDTGKSLSALPTQLPRVAARTTRVSPCKVREIRPFQPTDIFYGTLHIGRDDKPERSCSQRRSLAGNLRSVVTNWSREGRCAQRSQIWYASFFSLSINRKPSKAVARLKRRDTGNRLSYLSWSFKTRPERAIRRACTYAIRESVLLHVFPVDSRNSIFATTTVRYALRDTLRDISAINKAAVYDTPARNRRARPRARARALNVI